MNTCSENPLRVFILLLFLIGLMEHKHEHHHDHGGHGHSHGHGHHHSEGKHNHKFDDVGKWAAKFEKEDRDQFQKPAQVKNISGSLF